MDTVKPVTIKSSFTISPRLGGGGDVDMISYNIMIR